MNSFPDRFGCFLIGLDVGVAISLIILSIVILYPRKHRQPSRDITQ